MRLCAKNVADTELYKTDKEVQTLIDGYVCRLLFPPVHSVSALKFSNTTLPSSQKWFIIIIDNLFVMSRGIIFEQKMRNLLYSPGMIKRFPFIILG